MIQRREIKKPEAPVKELGLHKNNPNTQNKNAVITKAVLSLKPKPVPDPVVETVTPEPVLQRKKRPQEVFNKSSKAKKPQVKVTLTKFEHAKNTRAREFLIILKMNYPVIAQCLPLEIGVAKKLYDVYHDTSRRIINTALYIHTHCEMYVEFLSKGQGRFDLTGKFVSPIDTEGQEKALLLLSQIQKKKKELKLKLKKQVKE